MLTLMKIKIHRADQICSQFAWQSQSPHSSPEIETHCICADWSAFFYCILSASYVMQTWLGKSFWNLYVSLWACDAGVFVKDERSTQRCRLDMKAARRVQEPPIVKPSCDDHCCSADLPGDFALRRGKRHPDSLHFQPNASSCLYYQYNWKWAFFLLILSFTFPAGTTSFSTSQFHLLQDYVLKFSFLLILFSWLFWSVQYPAMSRF